jgi:hypothetical protein
LFSRPGRTVAWGVYQKGVLLMKIKTLLFVLMIVILSSCQTGTPEVTQAVPTPTTEAYPPPSNNNTDVEPPYPPPAQTPGDVSAYPSPGEQAAPQITTWVESEGLLLTGRVHTVTQTANLDISILLDDGRIYTSTAPDPGAVQQVLERCGDLCRNTSFIQE